jgi:hypothetical protein
MQRDEVRFAIDLAASEGWNPGRHDAGTFSRADPDGLLVGLRLYRRAGAPCSGSESGGTLPDAPRLRDRADVDRRAAGDRSHRVFGVTTFELG